MVGVRHDLRPWSIAGAREACPTLELPVGAACAAAIEVGDELVLEDVERRE